MYQFSVQAQEHDDGVAHALGALKQKLAALPADRLLFHIFSTVFSK